MANVILSAFLDGFTGGSLFTQARLPGEPTQLFADEDSECEHFELVASLLRMQERENQERDRAHSTNWASDKDRHESFGADNLIESDSSIYLQGRSVKGIKSIRETRKDKLGSMIRLTQEPEEVK